MRAPKKGIRKKTSGTPVRRRKSLEQMAEILEAKPAPEMPPQFNQLGQGTAADDARLWREMSVPFRELLWKRLREGHASVDLLEQIRLFVFESKKTVDEHILAVFSDAMEIIIKRIRNDLFAVNEHSGTIIAYHKHAIECLEGALEPGKRRKAAR